MPTIKYVVQLFLVCCRVSAGSARRYLPICCVRADDDKKAGLAGGRQHRNSLHGGGVVWLAPRRTGVVGCFSSPTRGNTRRKTLKVCILVCRTFN